MNETQTMMPRKFARIFQSAQRGLILMIATTDEDDDPCLQITVDTHPHFLSPTTVTVSFDADIDQFKKLDDMTQENAEELAEVIYKQAAQFVPDEADEGHEKL